MAKAAHVFQQKSRETVELLEKSESLAAEVEAKRKDLEHSNAELEQFVYTVSHDLRTPIVTSMGFIGVMKELAATGATDKALAKIPVLERANQRMSQLIDDLLDLSRVGRADRDLRELSSSTVAKRAVENLSVTIETSGAQVTVSDDMPQLWANESRLLQVFENLISNAIKYGARAGAAPEINIDGFAEGTTVRLFVRDHGPGIPEKHHERVFQLFQRLESDKKGTGVGLAIVQKVMQFHRGRVHIESREGEGACFWLEFPHAAEQRSAA